MEVTEFELTTLDAALFEIPPGLNAAMNIREMSKALSDANETQAGGQMNSAPAGRAAAEDARRRPNRRAGVHQQDHADRRYARHCVSA